MRKWTFLCSWWGSFSPQLRRYGLLHMVSSPQERNMITLQSLPLLLRYIRKLAKFPRLKQVLFLISCKSSVADTNSVSGSAPVELGSWQQWCSHQMRDSAAVTGENLPSCYFLSLCQNWCSCTWLSSKPHWWHVQRWKLNIWDRRKGRKINFHANHLPALSHGCIAIPADKERGECKIGSCDSSLHSDQHEASVKPLPKAQSVQPSHLAGESEAQFPTTIGLPF